MTLECGTLRVTWYRMKSKNFVPVKQLLKSRIGQYKKVVRRIQEGCKKDAFSCVRIPKDFFGRIIKLSHLNHRSPVAAIFPSGGKYEHSAVFQIPCWTRRQPDPIFPAYQPGAGRRGRYHARLRRIRWHAGERQFWYLWSFHPLPTGATWRFTPLPATW